MGLIPDVRPRTPRLIWRRLTPAHLEAFHRLATDPHVRRYLLDGVVVDRDWCRAEAERSAKLFAERGVGLWLVWLGDGMSDRTADAIGGCNEFDAIPSGEAIGFAGYRVFDDMGPEPQLLYAFTPDFVGRGLATEAGRALLDIGHLAGLDPIHSAVDGPNKASLRVLEKLGFDRVKTTDEGAFGETVYLTWRR